MREQWRKVVGFEAYLEVSNAGHVRSLDRVSEQRTRWGGVAAVSYTGRALSIGRTGPRRNYRNVKFRIDGQQYTRLVHRLVLEAFVGPRPEGMEACHSDGDTDNNRLNNLRWDTHAANEADKLHHGTHQFGERNTQAKLTAADVERIRSFDKAGLSRSSIARELGVAAATTGRVLRGVSWRHLRAAA